MQFLNLVRSSEYNQKCVIRSWDSINQQDECPTKRCTHNRDCWEEYGQSKFCVCDSHLCGAVCMEGLRVIKILCKNY